MTNEQLPNNVLLFSVVFKFILMIIGILGNINVIIYTVFMKKEKTMTLYLVANLALADFLMCVTFYPIWIIELTRSMLDIDSDQSMFCRISRSISLAFLLVSTLNLVAVTFDQYLYIAKPLKYPIIVTRRRVLAAISGMWLISCCLFILLVHIFITKAKNRRSYCDIPVEHFWPVNVIITCVPIILILILHLRILNIAQKQRRRILAETRKKTSREHSSKQLRRLLSIVTVCKTSKTFLIVVVVLAFSVFIPTVIGLVVEFSCSKFCQHLWFVIFYYEFYGVNSVVNAFVYGMRHVKYKKAYKNILLNVCHCNKQKNSETH